MAGDERSGPQRTCVGCRAVRPKVHLVRVVRTSEGGLRLDLTGKSPGRGAYVCRHEECVESALRRGVLRRALRTGETAGLETMARELRECVGHGGGVEPPVGK